MTSSTAAAPTATSFLRGRRSGLLFCLWATCAVLLALPAFASAALDPNPLAGSNFQAADGDQDAESGYDDWQTYASQVNTSGTKLDAPVPGAGNDHFYAGHENRPDEWVDSFVDGGITPAKSNALSAYGLRDPLTTNTFFYFAFIRESDSNANAFLGFELNERTNTWVNGAGTTIPCRSDGDLMISYEIDPPQKNVAIKFYRWDTDEAMPGPADCPEGKRGEFVAATGFGAGQAHMNFEDTITNYLRPDVFTNSLDPGLFGEGAVNVDQAIGTASRPCFNFGQVQLHTRSSASLDSALGAAGSPTLSGAAAGDDA